MKYKFRILKKKDISEYRLQRRWVWSPFWIDCYLDGSLLRAKDIKAYSYDDIMIVCNSIAQAERKRLGAERRYNPKPKDEWYPL